MFMTHVQYELVVVLCMPASTIDSTPWDDGGTRMARVLIVFWFDCLQPDGLATKELLTTTSATGFHATRKSPSTSGKTDHLFADGKFALSTNLR